MSQPVRMELAPLLPLPQGYVPDWDDVVRRAGAGNGHPRPLVLAAALVAVLAVAGVAVAAGFGGFSSWLTGEPGVPVSSAEQQAFEAANARTWTAFATGTQLRKLLETSASGTTFTLFGFRSGDDLCLKLALAGAQTGNVTRCAPEHDLQTATEPALVVSADEPFGPGGAPGADGYTGDAYQATFGIASDGIGGVVVDGDDGAHDAVLGGNAFLYVDDHPSHGARVRGITAVAGSGDRVALPFESSPYGFFDLAAPPSGTLHGPSTVQRRVTGGTISWVVAREDRGAAVPQPLAGTVGETVEHPPPAFGKNPWPSAPEHVVFERMVQPDPNDMVRVILAGVSPTSSLTDPEAGICVGILEGNGVGSGCNRFSDEFAHGPLDATIEGSGTSQYSLLSGLASDDVARIAAYLGNGDVVPVALRDNAFVARIARADYPLRVVAYDVHGLVVQVQDFASDGTTSAAPAAARASVKQIARLAGPGGGAVTLRAGTVTGGYRCWSLDALGGQSQGGCTPWPPHGYGLRTVGVMWSKGDAFVAGEVSAPIASVRASYSDGTTTTIDTSDGFALALAPAKSGAIELHGFDASGKEVASAGVKVSPEPAVGIVKG